MKLKVESRSKQQNINDCEKYLAAMSTNLAKDKDRKECYIRRMFCPILFILVINVWPYLAGDFPYCCFSFSLGQHLRFTQIVWELFKSRCLEGGGGGGGGIACVDKCFESSLQKPQRKFSKLNFCF